MTKKKNNRCSFITAILLLVFQIGLSQSYFIIPIDTNYYWRQFSLCLDGNNQVKRLDYQIRYYKDTTINGIIYNKYAPFGRAWGQPGCTSYVQYGFLRQDTLNRRVAMLDQNFIERPLYDFSKNLGDTLLSYNHVLKANETLTIMNVATATLSNGSHRKALWTSNQNCHIEGVGSIMGGLYGHTQLFVHGVSEQLMCFGTIIPFYELLEGISTQKYVCAFVPATVGISENPFYLSPISVYPTPTTGKFFIRLNDAADTKYRIIDLLGKEVLSGTLKINSQSNEIPVDISMLPNGVYSLQLLFVTGSLSHRRVVKQN